MTEQKQRLLIFNDYFYPAYKAGGPIQSLINLVIHLEDRFEIAIITSACDLNDKAPMDGVNPGGWTPVMLPGAKVEVNVWYVGLTESINESISSALKYFRPHVAYINGMFTYRYVIYPMLRIKDLKVVICPRGMIQEGALAGKYLKKKVYLSILNLTGVVKSVRWHATTEVEAGDIKKIFGSTAEVVVAGNIPRTPFPSVTYPDKNKDALRLVYISLITAKKNLLQAIEAINETNADITFDIYGPVKDVSYWEKCEPGLKKSNGKIVHKGDVIPSEVQSTFSRYDAGFFLTKAENFGHALYESMSAGRPIITSNFTPWRELEAKNAGWNVDIHDVTDIVRTLRKVVAMNKEEFNKYCNGAHQIASEYYTNGFDVNDYCKLFS